jgi:tetratricopeptide (TPR) repeat protein
MAHHFGQAGDLEAVHYLAKAAGQAEELYAYRHAIELYSRALSFLDAHQIGSPEERFDLILGREAILDRRGLRADQSGDVAELVRLAGSTGDIDRLAVASVREAGYLAYTNQFAKARQAGERALNLYREAGDQDGEARALRELGFLLWSANDFGAALTYARQALQLHRRRGDVAGEATALHNLAEIHRSLGNPRQAVAEYEAAMNLFWARQDRRRQGLALHGLAHALRQLGDLPGAENGYQQALAQFVAIDDHLMVSRVHHALAGLFWELDEREKAAHHMRRAVEISREIGYGPGIAHGLVALSDLLAQEGNTESAGEYLDQAINWLELVEDQKGLDQALVRQTALEQGKLVETGLSLAGVGWVKGHVDLAEGKVYCTFESPLAMP